MCDESHFRLSDAKRLAWAGKNDNVRLSTTSKTVKSVSIIGAISARTGEIHYKIFEGGVNKEIFAEFLVSLSARSVRPVAVLLDNAPCHRAKHV